MCVICVCTVYRYYTFDPVPWHGRFAKIHDHHAQVATRQSHWRPWTSLDVAPGTDRRSCESSTSAVVFGLLAHLRFGEGLGWVPGRIPPWVWLEPQGELLNMLAFIHLGCVNQRLATLGHHLSCLSWWFGADLAGDKKTIPPTSLVGLALAGSTWSFALHRWVWSTPKPRRQIWKEERERVNIEGESWKAAEDSHRTH